MAWKKSKTPASPKQLVQRSRFAFKGFLTATKVNANRWMVDDYTNTREKIFLVDLINTLDAHIYNCDEVAALMIRNTK